MDRNLLLLETHKKYQPATLTMVYTGLVEVVGHLNGIEKNKPQIGQSRNRVGGGSGDTVSGQQVNRLPTGT